MFHSRDGFYFERLEDGSVRVRLGRPVVRADGSLGISDVAVFAQTILPPNEWASVVASMEAGGEKHASWQDALKRQRGC